MSIKNEKDRICKEFSMLPNVGKAISQDLYDMGYRSITQLTGKTGEELYDELNALRGIKIDRCMLYTFRALVYFVSHKNPDPDKLQWWKWKNNE